MTIIFAMPVAGLAEEAPPAPDPDRAANLAAMEVSLAEALAVLRRASDFLTRQKDFRFEADIGYDVVQPIGLKLEFGGERRILVRRPDRFRVEMSNRSGESSIIRFDGKTLSAFFPGENAFATLEKAGTLEQSIAYLADDVGVPMPLSDFIESDFYAAVVDQIELGIVIGDETVGDRPCEHLAFQGTGLIFQLWVEKGERPLPRRVVIEYTEEEGSPKFWAQIHRWELGLDTSDEAFAFSPPEGAERLLTQPVVSETPSPGQP
jgi:hypothetical protein